MGIALRILRAAGAVALTVGVLALVGCAAPWTRPNTPDEQYRRDFTACAHLAEGLHPLPIEYRTPERPAMVPVQSPGSILMPMVMDQVMRERARTIANCMRERGYVPA